MHVFRKSDMPGKFTMQLTMRVAWTPYDTYILVIFLGSIELLDMFNV